RVVDFVLSRSVFVLCFFFQAEDGIRDATVTGVQTCALPISALTASPDNGRNRPPVYSGAPARPSAQKTGSSGQGALPMAAVSARSEERRVGKEGRWRWWADREKTKKERGRGSRAKYMQAR